MGKTCRSKGKSLFFRSGVPFFSRLCALGGSLWARRAFKGPCRAANLGSLYVVMLGISSGKYGANQPQQTARRKYLQHEQHSEHPDERWFLFDL